MLTECLLEMSISIHVPREGDDCGRLRGGKNRERFQSTSPVRGTTTVRLPTTSVSPYFNPRPP